MRVKTLLLGLAALIISFVVSLEVMNFLSPQPGSVAPTLVKLPPLPPPTRTSRIIAPVAISFEAIRAAAERAAPRNFAGKADNPIGQVLQNADINWTAERGPIAATGANNQLTITAPLTGKLNVTGSLSANAANALGGLIGGNIGKQLGNIAIKSVNADADIRGNVTVTSRPLLTEHWRIEPNLAAQVTIGDTGITAGGVRIGVPAQVKPVLDKLVGEQVGAIQQRIRNDPMLEQNARREWAKMCRSIALPRAAPNLPDLFLELRPTRAVAAQPRLDAANLILTLGVEAETRILSTKTTPSCPFPALLDIVPPTNGGSMAIGVPIDLPFSEVNAIVNAQLKGRTLPENGDSAVAVTVRSASVAPSGDRLLISLDVDAAETKSIFSLGAQATVHVWGRPTLDQAQQILRLTDIELAVESKAAFGLLGPAARAAEPYLRNMLAEKATIDLKPFAASARQRIEAALADFLTGADGVKVRAGIDSIRLVSVAFDNETLRVITEATGTAGVTVTALPTP
ncbi:MAG: DUF4403 family protein [Pseudomonadota bacterium]|jgi:hypothetical protein